MATEGAATHPPDRTAGIAQGLFWGAFGSCGWVLGVAVLAIGTGTPSFLWSVALPGLGLSLGLYALVIAALAAFHHSMQEQSTVARGRALVGAVVLGVSTLLLAVQSWALPQLMRHPVMSEALRATGSATGEVVPPAVIGIAMLIGTALIARPTIALVLRSVRS